nr:thioredoxin domain-containing protein [Campylobacter sp.]
MKKILSASLLASVSLFGLSNDEILKFYKNIAPEELQVSIVSREKVEGLSGYESVIIGITDGKNTENDVIFIHENLVLPEIIDLKNSKSYKKGIMDKILNAKLKDIYKNENPKRIISIGKDKSKPTSVVFSDPECPFCREELASIEKRLKNENIKMILISVHGESALAKSYLIYEECAKAKSDSEKVKILRKY